MRRRKKRPEHLTLVHQCSSSLRHQDDWTRPHSAPVQICIRRTYTYSLLIPSSLFFFIFYILFELHNWKKKSKFSFFVIRVHFACSVLHQKRNCFDDLCKLLDVVFIGNFCFHRPLPLIVPCCLSASSSVNVSASIY